MPANTRTKVGEVEMVDKTTVSYSLKVGFSMRQIRDSQVQSTSTSAPSSAAQAPTASAAAPSAPTPAVALPTISLAEATPAAAASSVPQAATTTQKELSPGISLYTTKYQNQQGKVVGMCYEVQSDTALEFTLSIDGSRNLQLTDGSMKCTTQMPANTRTKVGEVEMVDKTTVSYSLKVGFSMRQISVCADPTSASAGPSQLTTTAGPAGSDNTTASSAAAAITAATSIPAATVEPGNGNAGTGTGHRKLSRVSAEEMQALNTCLQEMFSNYAGFKGITNKGCVEWASQHGLLDKKLTKQDVGAVRLFVGRAACIDY
jgi:hypothetical protein